MQSNENQRLDALTTALNHLLQNQDVLERRITHLEGLLQVDTKVSAVSAEPEPVVVPASQPLPQESIPVETVSTEATLESKVGLTVVNRIGAVTLVLGIAFFFKWAVDNDWIGPAGRVILGLLAGFCALAAADFIWRKRQQVFAQGITATGIAIIYLALYAAFDFYHLIPQSAAFLLLFATTVMAAVLALRYSAIAIAALGLVAAYATPLLLSSGEDHPWFLFSYLLLLNFAATELARRGEWHRLEWISFLATTLIYGGWLLDGGTRTEKHLVATLAPLAFTAQRWRTRTPLLFSFSQFLTAFALWFIWAKEESTILPLALLVAAAGLTFAQLRAHRLTVLTTFMAFWLSYGGHLDVTLSSEGLPFLGVSCGFLLFLLWSWWHLLQQRAEPSTLALSVFSLNGVIYYAVSYNILHSHHHLWLGPLAAVVAGVYLVFGIVLNRQAPDSGSDKRPLLLSLGIALSFLTLAIPVQFTGFTITIAWAIQGAALSWIASCFHSQRMILAAVLVFALVAGRLLLFETESLPDPLSYPLLGNARFFTFAVAAAAMLLSSLWAAKVFRPAALATYFAGNIFLLWGLCLEIIAWAARSASVESRLSLETIAISILFGVYAVILVSVGVATRTTINRLSGLGLIGIVILKLYFFDVWQLSRPFQIIAFVILGILLLSTSFLYSHFRRLIESWWKDEKTVP